MKENAKIKTIDEYIGTCCEEIQPNLRNIRKIILDASLELTEKISWGMTTFYFKGNIIHSSVHKKHIGLYCGAKAVQNIVKFNVEKNRNK